LGIDEHAVAIEDQERHWPQLGFGPAFSFGPQFSFDLTSSRLLPRRPRLALPVWRARKIVSLARIASSAAPPRTSRVASDSASAIFCSAAFCRRVTKSASLVSASL